MSDVITIKTSVRFKTWRAPNFASVDQGARPRQEGMRPDSTIAVADLDPEVLDALAMEWLTDLYSKVQREPPFIRKASQ